MNQQNSKELFEQVKNMSIKEFAEKYNIHLLKKKPVLMVDAPIYQWAEENWLTQNKTQWIYDEVPMAQDKNEWKELDKNSTRLLEKLFIFFTQIEVEVNKNYVKYLDIFQPFEIKKMLLSFASMETMHAAAYKYLMVNVFGGNKTDDMMHDFLRYATMKEKYDMLQDYKLDTIENLCTTIVMFGAFSEGVLLYASFAIFLFFPYVKKILKGFGQILGWSMRDESLHVESMAYLYKSLINQCPSFIHENIESKIYEQAKKMVDLEISFVDFIFEDIEIEHISTDILKEYIFYMADFRLKQFGFKPIYGVNKNPLSWMDAIGNTEFANFFEVTVNEYSKVALVDKSFTDKERADLFQI